MLSQSSDSNMWTEFHRVDTLADLASGAYRISRPTFNSSIGILYILFPCQVVKVSTPHFSVVDIQAMEVWICTCIFPGILCFTYHLCPCSCKTSQENYSANVPVVYVVTPTYERATQEPDLLRVAQALMLTSNVLWIVVEDSYVKTNTVCFSNSTYNRNIEVKNPTVLKFNIGSVP